MRRTMEELRIIHTSDVHLGAPFEFLGSKGVEQRLALRAALERIVRIAREGRYAALVIAGDLFDSAYNVTEGDLSFAIRCLADAGPGCTVVILPGSHDFWAPGSVYERERRRFEADGAIRILSPGRSVVELPELSAAVQGQALTSRVAADTVSRLVPLESYRWNIALAHGSVGDFAGAPEARDHPVDLAALADGFSYVALGHWHSRLVIRQSGPPVVYSGSPEIVARDQRGAGSVVSISCSDDGVRFEPISVGVRRVVETSIDCTRFSTTEELVRAAIASAAPDGNLILEVRLNGIVAADAVIDLGQVLEVLTPHYFSVRLAGRGPLRAVSREEFLKVPDDTVAGKFVRTMLRKMESTPEAERELYAEALQVGYQLFMGRNPLG
jgi:exonuclease SbcD